MFSDSNTGMLLFFLIDFVKNETKSLASQQISKMNLHYDIQNIIL